MRDGFRSTIGLLAMLSLMTPIGETHQIGPGKKKSPARGVRLDVEQPRAKKKSDSLKRLLRK